ncbi:hypothetical protein ACP4OV_024317 [Aristida adscensionis]
MTRRSHEPIYYHYSALAAALADVVVPSVVGRRGGFIRGASWLLLLLLLSLLHIASWIRRQQMPSSVRAPRAMLVPAALLVLLMSLSSSWHAAHGVRTTPGGGPLDVAVPDDAARRVEAASSEVRKTMRKERAATGSRLPDCAHACGACSPCRRVMVSFRCAARAQAQAEASRGGSESCPVAYRCMCRGRFFHVPSV